MSALGDLQRRLLALMFEAQHELDDDDLDKFLNGCTVIVSTAVARGWEKQADQRGGWA